MTRVPWLPLWTVLQTSESVADIRTQSRRPNSRLKNGRARLLPSRTEHQTCLSGSAGASPSHPIEYFNKLLSPKTPICVRHYTSIRGGDMARRRCAKKIWFTHAPTRISENGSQIFPKIVIVRSRDARILGLSCPTHLWYDGANDDIRYRVTCKSR